MTRAELLALAERVEKGETRRKFSAEIYRAAGFTVRLWNSSTTWQLLGVADEWEQMPDLTTSIDAQAALPAWIMRVELAEDPNLFIAYAVMKVGHPGINLASTGIALTEPAARLAALLRAMAEGGE